jgi:hypothetical protein
LPSLPVISKQTDIKGVYEHATKTV